MNPKDIIEILVLEKAKAIEAGKRIAEGLKAEQAARQQLEQRVKELEARAKWEEDGRPWNCGPQRAQG